MQYSEVYVGALEKKVFARLFDLEESQYFIDQEFANLHQWSIGKSQYFFYMKTVAALTFGPEAYECIFSYERNFDQLCGHLGFKNAKRHMLESLIHSYIDLADAKTAIPSLEHFKESIDTLMKDLYASFKFSAPLYSENKKKIQGELHHLQTSIVRIWDLARYSIFLNAFPLYDEFLDIIANGNREVPLPDVSANSKSSANLKKKEGKKEETQEISESKIKNVENELKKTVKGQEEAIREIANALSLRASGISERLPTIYVFLGPTGVGKTHLTRELNKYLFDGKKRLFEMSGSNFYDKHTISKLVGSPAGYVGYDEESGLAKHVKENPGSSLMLFDEFEKAHDSIWNILLTYADTGIIQDAKNKELDLRDTLMILTGNVGSSDFKRELGFVSGDISKQMERHVKSSLEKLLRPELKGRIHVVYFNPLSGDAKKQILELEMGYAAKRLEKKRDISLEISEPLREYLLQQGFDEKKGARGLKNMLKTTVFIPLSKYILENNLKETAISANYSGGEVKFCQASQSTAQSSPKSTEEQTP